MLKRFPQAEIRLERLTLETEPDVPERDEVQEAEWAEVVAEFLLDQAGPDLYYVGNCGLPTKPRNSVTVKERVSLLKTRETLYAKLESPQLLSEILEAHIDYEFLDGCAWIPELGEDWSAVLQGLAPEGVWTDAIYEQANWLVSFGCEEMKLELLSKSLEFDHQRFTRIAANKNFSVQGP